MSHFTQLNLQGNSEPKSAPSKPAKSLVGNKHQHGSAKVAAIVGSLMIATLVAIFTLGTNGCSKQKKVADKSDPTPMSASSAFSTVPTAPTPEAATPKPAKKSPRQHKLATFKNADYGLSFRYPKHYNLKEGEELSAETAKPTEMNFVQPGGTTLSTIELPETLYAGTDFTSAYFSVSVNPKLSADECSQFAFLGKADNPDSGAVAAKVNVAGTQYSEMDDSVSEGTMQSDARYFHIYQNNACYEFALGLQTGGDDGSENVKPVNRDKVFDKLQWMLSTVKIKPVEMPEVSASAPVAAASEPTSTNNQ